MLLCNPFLSQLGGRGGGWFSIDCLETLHVHNLVIKSTIYILFNYYSNSKYTCMFTKMDRKLQLVLFKGKKISHVDKHSSILNIPNHL